MNEEFYLKYEEKKVNALIDDCNERLKKIPIVLEDGKVINVGVVFSDTNASEIGNELAKRNSDLDFIMIPSAKLGAVSLRGINENMNLGDIAKAVGGGGHKFAAGFSLDKEDKEKLVDIFLTYLG
jgi:nanoRNase/pAp phosphatase (c-di-AMP/oligoRNAs hydrolase)